MNRNATYPSKYYPAHPWRLVPRIEISSRDTRLSHDYYLTVEFIKKSNFSIWVTYLSETNNPNSLNIEQFIFSEQTENHFLQVEMG